MSGNLIRFKFSWKLWTLFFHDLTFFWGLFHLWQLHMKHDMIKYHYWYLKTGLHSIAWKILKSILSYRNRFLKPTQTSNNPNNTFHTLHRIKPTFAQVCLLLANLLVLESQTQDFLDPQVRCLLNDTLYTTIFCISIHFHVPCNWISLDSHISHLFSICRVFR